MAIYQSLQGNLGLGKAIEYFVSWGYTVSLPLNDTQKYDLLVEKSEGIKKVSVKTSRSTKNNQSYSVQLRNTGGNRTGTVRQVNFDNASVDYVFIYLADERTFLIPSKDIENINSITVGIKYLEHEVKPALFKDYIETIEEE